MSENTKELIKKLSEKDENKVLETLKIIQEKGNETVIKPLLELGLNRDEESIHEQLQEIFFNLKISSSHPIVLDELSKMSENPFRRIVIASVWNANINGLGHLDTFVKIAIEGDYYEALECLTVIEESEGELIEEKILDSMLILKEYMADEKNSKDVKYPIIDSILKRVNILNQGRL